jgi:hypothetical protein
MVIKTGPIGMNYAIAPAKCHATTWRLCRNDNFYLDALPQTFFCAGYTQAFTSAIRRGEKPAATINTQSRDRPPSPFERKYNLCCAVFKRIPVLQ